jgi:hypothetical protein
MILQAFKSHINLINLLKQSTSSPHPHHHRPDHPQESRLLATNPAAISLQLFFPFGQGKEELVSNTHKPP